MPCYYHSMGSMQGRVGLLPCKFYLQHEGCMPTTLYTACIYPTSSTKKEIPRSRLISWHNLLCCSHRDVKLNYVSCSYDFKENANYRYIVHLKYKLQKACRAQPQVGGGGVSVLIRHLQREKINTPGSILLKFSTYSKELRQQTETEQQVSCIHCRNSQLHGKGNISLEPGHYMSKELYLSKAQSVPSTCHWMYLHTQPELQPPTQ